MFREQWIEMTGYPGGFAALKLLFDSVQRDDFRSGIQKQSLTVTYCDLRTRESGVA